MEEYLKKYPPVLSIKEVSEILQVSNPVVRHMVALGIIPSLRVGRQIKIPKAQLLRYLDSAS